MFLQTTPIFPLPLTAHGCLVSLRRKTYALWYHGLFVKNVVSWTYDSLFSSLLVRESKNGNILKPVPGAMFGLF